MAKIYKNKDIPDDYKFIGNISDYYYDLYDKSNIQGSAGNYFRVFYGLDPDYFEFRSYSNNSYYATSFQEVETTSSFLARPDNYKIITCGFCIIFLIIFLINIMTSIIKKGGLLGGLL